MNKEQIDKAIELLQAMKDGAMIECKSLFPESDWKYAKHIMDEKDDMFDFYCHDYRAIYPKLTADVFNRDDCPEWANFTAVFKDGRAFYFETKPFISGIYWCNNSDSKIIGKFDATDWNRSLIERPVENKLPEWCKVGAKVFFYDGVVTIISIGDKISIREQDGNMIMDCNINHLSPAVYVLPTIDEIFQRSSLVVKSKKSDYFATITGSNVSHQIYISTYGDMPQKIQLLDDLFTWSNDESIGKWVKGDK